jgi:SAM-dependent methyltransferase
MTSHVKASKRRNRLVPPPKSTAPPPLADSLGRLPAGTRVFDRVAYLTARAEGRRVVHLGFVDARNMIEKVNSAAWLHANLSEVAAHLVGIDADSEGVSIARDLGYEATVADCQSAESIAHTGVEPADVVIAGELIEHLDRPGDFLDAVKQLISPGGELVITTPNSTSLTNTLLAFAGREVQNADHVNWQSWRTMDALLTRHGYQLTELAYYRHPRYVPQPSDPFAVRARCHAFNTFQAVAWPLFAAAPSLADGLIAVARPL